VSRITTQYNRAAAGFETFEKKFEEFEKGFEMLAGTFEKHSIS
jgi:hypothetical protein